MAPARRQRGFVLNVDLNSRFSATSFTLVVPSRLNDAISVLCRAGTSAQGADEEHVPFRRKVDFWMLALGASCALDLTPLADSSSSWGGKFVDTVGLRNLPQHFGGLLMTLAISEWGHDDQRLRELSEIVELANRFAGAGAPKLLEAARPVRDQTRLEALLQNVSGWREGELARSGLELGGLEVREQRVPAWE